MTPIEFDKFIEREDNTMKSSILKAMLISASAGLAMTAAALATGNTIILAMPVDSFARDRG
jgi:hypothetical protein